MTLYHKGTPPNEVPKFVGSACIVSGFDASKLDPLISQAHGAGDRPAVSLALHGAYHLTNSLGSVAALAPRLFGFRTIEEEHVVARVAATEWRSLTAVATSLRPAPFSAR